MTPLTALEALAVAAVAGAVGLAITRFVAHRGVWPMLPVGIGLFLALGASIGRLLVGEDADTVLLIAVSLVFGGGIYVRWDQWQDARRARLQAKLDEATQDLVITGISGDPRDQEPGDSRIKVMPRAMERHVRRQERHQRREQR